MCTSVHDTLYLCTCRAGQRLRIDELARRLGVSVRHLRRLVEERRIPSLKVGHFVMFDEGEISSWLEECRRPAEGGKRPA